MKITEALTAEHRLLRRMLDEMGGWLAAGVAPELLRERALMLEVAVDDHAAREEQLLFEPLRAVSTEARAQVDLMEVVHDEVRDLFAQVADPSHSPVDRLWTILSLTAEHFTKEENGVFPLAVEVMGDALPDAPVA